MLGETHLKARQVQASLQVRPGHTLSHMWAAARTGPNSITSFDTSALNFRSACIGPRQRIIWRLP